MSNELVEYKKTKEYLVCVDSDGCAIDSMDIKHITCFGPCMIKVWNLFKWEEDILKRWNDINLYTITRGINRFKGLVKSLKEINDKYIEIDGIEELEKWVENTKELSNDSLSKYIETNNNEILKLALEWSNMVNSNIKRIPKNNIVPFENVSSALKFVSEYADVAIVSSANLNAVLEEWERYDLIKYTNIVLAQNAGSKAYCIGELLKKGYSKDKVVMCGDSLGDLEASIKNNVHFYPILVKKEKESWLEFIEKGFNNLVSGEYSQYESSKVEEFKNNLNG